MQLLRSIIIFPEIFCNVVLPSSSCWGDVHLPQNTSHLPCLPPLLVLRHQEWPVTPRLVTANHSCCTELGASYWPRCWMMLGGSSPACYIMGEAIISWQQHCLGYRKSGDDCTRRLGKCSAPQSCTTHSQVP